MTQVFSQNGWPAYDTTAHFTRFTAANQRWWAANPDVAVVFTEFIEQFDKRIEEITQKLLDDWSYANRLVRGSTKTVSNHGSATAIDIDATQHPRGVKNTFSAKEQVIMRDIKNKITDNAGVSVLRLGMDYKTTVDDMHIEINASPAKVKQAANKIRERNKPKPPAPPKETPVAIPKVDLNLKQEFVLGESAASQMNTTPQPFKKGDKVGLDFLLQWGGPGIFRLWKNISSARTEIASLKQQVSDLQNVVAPMRGDLARMTEQIRLLTEALEEKPPAGAPAGS
jgi:uncharacterized coiled-coil protein SlyX